MARLRVVVVEDQPLTRLHLVEMIERLGADVIEACADGQEAVERIPALDPDAVFLDVQMPLVDGFDVIEAIGPDVMPPVVFVTAYDVYAVKAFEVYAFAYLLKPVSEQRMADVLERLRTKTVPTSKRTRELLALLNRPKPPGAPERLVVRGDGRLTFVSPDDVEWIEANGNYATIHARGGRHVVRQPLHSLQRRLVPIFARAHRSALVNLRYVTSLKFAPHGECDVILRSGKVLRVTRRFRPELERMLRELP